MNIPIVSPMNPSGLPHPAAAPVVDGVAWSRFAGPFALLLALALTMPLWIGRVGLYPYIALEIVIWALFALSYNLLLGQGGLPSFGHGAFFGIGAYAFGLAVKHVAPNLWLGMAARPRRWPARWWRCSSRTGAASTTR